MSGDFWRRYRRNALAWWSTLAFTALLAAAAGANLVANDRPLVMRLGGATFFPAVVDYSAEEVGQPGFVADFLALRGELEAPGNWAVWPPLVQRPYEPNLQFDALPAPPVAHTTVAGRPVTHWLGTDTAGRDLLTRLLYGCRTSLLMALAITALSLALGVALGALMGYFGGVFDLIVGRLLETLGYFPVLFLIVILVAFLETPALATITVIFAVIGMPPFAFYMRGQVLSLRKQTFVEAAVALGQTSGKILWRHVLPNALSPIVVLVPFTVTSEITFLATIDFLGFGVQPPTASLGAILRAGFDNAEGRSWLIAYASAVLVAVLLLVNFIGDGVRDGMDPHPAPSRKAWKKMVADAQA